MNQTMNHIVLLGDSIFDNGAYVHRDRGEKPVLDQLRGLLPDGWDVTLVAVDGHRIADVCRQLDRAPADASHLVISVGGNDALGQGSVLDGRAGTVSDALVTLARTREKFRREYRQMLDAVCARGKATVVCTIYDRCPLGAEGGLPDENGVLQAAVAVFDDLIIGEAIRARVPVLDLRPICDDPADYSDKSPIEPSAAGGAKIARAIWRIVAGHDFRRRQTVLFGSEE